MDLYEAPQFEQLCCRPFGLAAGGRRSAAEAVDLLHGGECPRRAGSVETTSTGQWYWPVVIHWISRYKNI